MTSYHVYGLVIQTAYPLGPPRRMSWEREGSAADVEFMRGCREDFTQVRKAFELRAAWPEPWFQRVPLPDGRDYLRWPKLFEFLISADGRRIRGCPLRQVAPETFQTYLFGQVLSFALVKQGIESLHATTVVKEGKAAAFLGGCGDGKSTLAAACLQQGFRLLTDDQLLLREDGLEALAHPGPPRLKLMPGLAKRFFGRGTEGCPMNPLTAKRIMPLPAAQVASSPVPLRAIYVLRARRPPPAARGVAIRRLSTGRAWYELTRGTFNPVVQEPPRLARQFAWASRLAQRVPVFTLSYPRTLRRLPDVVEAVAAHLSGS